MSAAEARQGAGAAGPPQGANANAPPRTQDSLELLALAAMWGSVFLLIRLSVTDFGVWSLAWLRISIGALCLAPLLLWQPALRQALRQHWRAIAVIGLFNMALPALLFCYAAQHLTSGLIAILNSTSPLFAAAIGALWLGAVLTRWQVAGLALGFCGVLALSLDAAGVRTPQADWAIAACLAAALCYGFTVNCMRRYLSAVPSMAVVIGSLVIGGLLMAAPGVLAWPAGDKSLTAWNALLAMGIGATALGFVMYFRLIANIGPTRAIAVTFLMPVFAMFWGWLFLSEPVSLAMLASAAVIIAGTALSTGMLRPT